MHGATHYLAVLGEDDFYVGLLDDGCVEVADKDSGVEGAWVILVGHVAGLGFTSHSPPVALLGHRHRGGGGEDMALEVMERPTPAVDPAKHRATPKSAILNQSINNPIVKCLFLKMFIILIFTFLYMSSSSHRPTNH